jgi:hypothetical protein
VLTHLPPQHWRPIPHAGLQALAPLDDPVVPALPEMALPLPVLPEPALLPDPEVEPLPPVDASLPAPTNVEPPQRDEPTIKPASKAKPRRRFQPMIIATPPGAIVDHLGWDVEVDPARNLSVLGPVGVKAAILGRRAGSRPAAEQAAARP